MQSGNSHEKSMFVLASDTSPKDKEQRSIEVNRTTCDLQQQLPVIDATTDENPFSVASYSPNTALTSTPKAPDFLKASSDSLEN